MLWSLVKILIFVTLVAGLTLGAAALMENGQGLQLTVGGWEFTLGPLQAMIAVVLLFLLVWLVIRIAGLLVASFRFLNGDETAISRYFDRNRERKGYEALADGMLALASGDGRQALSKAARAEKFLARPELTDLVSAQAAEMTGDSSKAEEVYKRLLQHDRTRFVGVRGLMKQRLDAGDTDTALRLAQKAFALKPKHEEIQDTLLSLQAENEDWGGARDTLGAKVRHGALPRDVHKRRDAVLALSEAKQLLEQEDGIKGQEAAIEANRLSPDLVPAAVLAAQSYIAQDRPKYAVRVIRKAWSVGPHPDLAAAFAAMEPDETPDQRLARFAPLFKTHPDHAQVKMLRAELLIAAEDFPAARKALGTLVEDEPTVRALTLMAAIERGEGEDDVVVRGWLTRALSAPRDPQWICDKCNTSHAEWAPVCKRCASLDSLSWQTRPAEETEMPASSDLLPLIVKARVDEETAAQPEDDIDAGAIILDGDDIIDSPAPDFVKPDDEDREQQ